jgi:hypothetical protein
MNKIISFNFDNTKKNVRKKSEISTNSKTLKKKNVTNRQTLLKYIHNFQDKNHGVSENKDNIAFTSSVNYMTELSNKLQECDLLEKDDMMKSPNPILLTPSNVDKPHHGCLKNGSLPTYREYQKQLLAPPPLPFPASLPDIVPAPIPAPVPVPVLPIQSYPKIDANAHVTQEENQEKIKIKIKNEQEQEQEQEQEPVLSLEKKNQSISPAVVVNTPNDTGIGGTSKRTVKRTYHVGKCKSKRKISVLICNKSKHNEISNKNQLVKRTPLHTVKRFLVKRGLIKVGCIAPSAVLRKMYESVESMCGNVINHNTDTLLHNYMNDDTSN